MTDPVAVAERIRWSIERRTPEQRRAVARSCFQTWMAALGDTPIPEGKVLVIGCNRGWCEVDACEAWPDREVHATDLIEPEEEPDWWREARKRFPRLSYHPGLDAQEALPGDGYAVVLAGSVLHHLPRLEAALNLIRSRMVPGGVLLVSEYVGKAGLVSDAQRHRVAAKLWSALPLAYRVRRDGTEQVAPRWVPEGEASGYEAVCSERIVPALRERFTALREHFSRPLGGYRCIVWGEHGIRQLNPDVDRLFRAVEDVLMTEGWLPGEDLVGVYRAEAHAQPWRIDTQRHIATHHADAVPMLGRVSTDDHDGTGPYRRGADGELEGFSALYGYLDAVLDLDARLDGPALEFGVFLARSTNHLARRIAPAVVHGFDSFMGLPEPWEDRSTANPAGTVRKGAFDMHGALPNVEDNVRLHVGWFRDTVPAWLADPANRVPIRLIHVDCDLYSSTMDALTPLAEAGCIVPGTVIAFDELWGYSAWRQHEWRALQELTARFGWRWRVTRYLKRGYQAAVVIEGGGVA